MVPFWTVLHANASSLFSFVSGTWHTNEFRSQLFYSFPKFLSEVCQIKKSQSQKKKGTILKIESRYCATRSLGPRFVTINRRQIRPFSTGSVKFPYYIRPHRPLTITGHALLAWIPQAKLVIQDAITLFVHYKFPSSN